MEGLVNAAAPTRPRIVELIGTAGAGKSAVARALEGQPGVLCTSLWTVPLPALAWATVCSTPASLGLMRRAGAPLSREFRHIARLRALLNFLDRDDLDRYRLVVVDEGAVYTLAWLRVIGHPVFSDQRSASWRRYIAALWAAVLDGVVRLDAPDDVLARRVRTRAKAHVLSSAPDAVIGAFSARYRAAFDEVLASLTQHGTLSIREFRTDRMTPEQVAAELLNGAPAVPELVHG